MGAGKIPKTYLLGAGIMKGVENGKGCYRRSNNFLSQIFYQSVQKLIAVGCWNKSVLGGKFLKNYLAGRCLFGMEDYVLHTLKRLFMPCS